MRLFLVLLSFLGAHISHAETACTIVRTESHNLEGSGKVIGTGFFIDDQLIITPDHSLAPNVQKVDFYFSQQKVPASAIVVGRDYHTDIAVLRYQGEKVVSPCLLSDQEKIVLLERVTILGTENHNDHNFSVNARVMNPSSSNLLVPGIYSSLELASLSETSLPVRSSMSGSVVLFQDKVVGFISQVTESKTALAIPTATIRQVVKQIVENKLPVRPYIYNQQKNNFSFSGLSFSAQDQNVAAATVIAEGGNPHGGFKPIEQGEDNVNRGKLKNIYGIFNGNSAVSAFESDHGAVIANVEDIQTLEKTQPDLAKVIEETHSKKVIVKSIDGQEIHDIFQLLRTLGTCSTCIIDQFLVSEVNVDDQNTTGEMIGHIGQLIETFKKTKTETFVGSSAICSLIMTDLKIL